MMDAESVVTGKWLKGTKMGVCRLNFEFDGIASGAFPLKLFRTGGIRITAL
jgi:hypothetical protein